MPLRMVLQDAFLGGHLQGCRFRSSFTSAFSFVGMWLLRRLAAAGAGLLQAGAVEQCGQVPVPKNDNHRSCLGGGRLWADGAQVRALTEQKGSAASTILRSRAQINLAQTSKRHA